MKKKKETFKEGVRRRYLSAFDETVERLNVNDKDVCEQIAVLPQHVSLMRSGKRYPTLENLVSICDKYDYDLEWIIRGEHKLGTRRPAPDATIEMVYEELQDLKEQQADLVGKMLDALIVLKKGTSPLGPDQWKEIFKKS